jgi:hypothetical protein
VKNGRCRDTHHRLAHPGHAKDSLNPASSMRSGHTLIRPDDPSSVYQGTALSNAPVLDSRDDPVSSFASLLVLRVEGENRLICEKGVRMPAVSAGVL